MQDNDNTKSLQNFQASGDINSKLSIDYGKQIISEIDSFIKSDYFLQRNKRFDKNIAMASGKLDFGEIQMLLDMQQKDKKDYAKIIWKGIMIVNTIISRLSGRWSQSVEKPIAKAVDKTSVEKKQIMIDSAEFYMQFKKELADIQEQSGTPMVPQGQFVPEDKDHLDIWTKYELYLPEEYLYTKKISQILDKNGFGFTGIKRRMQKRDTAEAGFVGTYTWSDNNGEIIVERVTPKNAIYSYSEYDDFRDCKWMGQVVSKSIGELREQFPDLSEKDLFDKVVPYTKQWNESDKLTGSWNNQWGSCFSRPYDDWNVDIVMFELRSLDNETYSMKVTSNGSLLIEKESGKSNLSGKISKESKKVWNVYEGIYVKANKYLLKWDTKENPVSSQDPRNTGYKEFSYSFNMYQSIEMRNLAVPEKIEEPIIQMLIVRIKIQELVAKMRAAGLLVDVDGLQEINLGTGAGALKPIEIERVYNQTGTYYYRGRDAEGMRVDQPIKELPNAGSVPQLQELVNLYNFHLQVVRDETGINESAEGQTAKPRTTNSNVQASLQISFNSTDYMNDACINVIEQTSKKIACLLHDSVEFGSKQYSDIVQEEFVKGREYDIEIKMAPTDDEVNLLMGEVNLLIQSNPTFILYIDPLKIRTIAEDSIELASVYFRRAQRKALDGEANKAQQQSQDNANIQAKAGMQVAEANQKVEDSKSSNELALAKEKQKEIILTGIFGIYQKGLQVPNELKPLEGEIITNLALPLFAQNAQMKQAASQTPHPQEQPPQEQENPQENMQEQGQEEPMQ